MVSKVWSENEIQRLQHNIEVQRENIQKFEDFFKKCYTKLDNSHFWCLSKLHGCQKTFPNVTDRVSNSVENPILICGSDTSEVGTLEHVIDHICEDIGAVQNLMLTICAETRKIYDFIGSDERKTLITSQLYSEEMSASSPPDTNNSNLVVLQETLKSIHEMLIKRETSLYQVISNLNHQSRDLEITIEKKVRDGGGGRISK